MDNETRFVITPRNVLGISIALLGALLTLDRLGVMHAERVFRNYWPVPIIVMGALMIVQAVNPRERVRGAIFTGIGVWLFLSTQGLTRFRIWEFFWPALLILIGLSMALRSGRPGWRHRRYRPSGPEGPPRPDGPPGPGSSFGFSGPASPGGLPAARRGRDTGPGSAFYGYADRADHISLFAVLSGSRRTSSAPAFKGGDITAIMGGAQLDLRQAAIPPGEDAVLDVTTVMGGVELSVPAHWDVVTPIVSILGGVEDERLPSIQNDPGTSPAPARLVIRGFVFMGGVHIKS